MNTESTTDAILSAIDATGALETVSGALEAPEANKRRVAAALEALAPNSRRQYGSAWRTFAAWCDFAGRQALPAAAETLADYLRARHAAGASPATIRLDRAAICKVHAVQGMGKNPGADPLVKDTLHALAREGRDRGRGQARGIGWAAAEAAASLAVQGKDKLAGLRDAALIRVASDTLTRISELAALQVADVEGVSLLEGAGADGEGGTIAIRAGKTDQTGEGDTRYIGPATLAAVRRWMDAAAISEGPLFRRIRRGDVLTEEGLAPESVRAIFRRRAARVEAIGGQDRLGGQGCRRVSGHSFRVGSAQELARDGASIAELQQAGGWKSAEMPGSYVRRESAARGPMARRRYGIGP